jgi:small nuclear ribonucleoprotein (snRNP)-like protein
MTASIKIRDELVKACGLKLAANEAPADVVTRLMKAVAKLTDPEWNALSPEAMEWYNTNADLMGEKKAPLGFEEPAAAAPSRRRPAAEPEAEDTSGTIAEPPNIPANKLSAGEVVEVTLSTGEIIDGSVVEVDEKNLVLAVPPKGEEEVYRLSKVVKINYPADATRPAAVAADYEMSTGDKVKVTLTDGTEMVGLLVEFDEKNIVVNGADGEDVYRRSKVKSVELVESRASMKSSGRGRPTKAAEPEAGTETKRTRSTATSADGKPASQVMRELTLRNLTKSRDDVLKLVRKALPDGSFKDNTFELVHAETLKVVKTLQELGMLKDS